MSRPDDNQGVKPKSQSKLNTASLSRLFSSTMFTTGGPFMAPDPSLQGSNAQFLQRASRQAGGASHRDDDTERRQEDDDEGVPDVDHNTAVNPHLVWDGSGATRDSHDRGHVNAPEPTKKSEESGSQNAHDVHNSPPSQGDHLDHRDDHRDGERDGQRNTEDARRQRLHLPPLPRHLAGSQPELQLSRIEDEDIRAFLDPNNTSITPQIIASWDENKLNALVDAIEPYHMSTIIRRSVEWQSTERCKSLTWSNISLKNKDGHYALRNVSGFLMPGMTVAILAAPDAGATNLLNILAGRQETGIIGGEVRYDGRLRTRAFQRHVGYVMKDDVAFSLLTVFETLLFSAETRTPHCPSKISKFRVKVYMKLLGLSHAADTVIGDSAIKGVSGGERRRVSYGVEMVAGHGCILADLPTNGLDSASANSLIKTIRYINRSGGRSMMCSVVQPAPALFHLFDTVLLLSKGSVLYFGPTSSCLAFIEAAGFVQPRHKSEPQFLEELTATPEKFYQVSVKQQGRIKEQTQPNTNDKKTDMIKNKQNDPRDRQQEEEKAHQNPDEARQEKNTNKSSGNDDEPKTLADDDETMQSDHQREELAKLEKERKEKQDKNGDNESGKKAQPQANDDDDVESPAAAGTAGNEEEKVPSPTSEQLEELRKGNVVIPVNAEVIEKAETTRPPPTPVREEKKAVDDAVNANEKVATIKIDNDEEIKGTPVRIRSWQLMKDRYERSLYAQRVVGIVSREKDRAEGEDARRQSQREGRSGNTLGSSSPPPAYSYDRESGDKNEAIPLADKHDVEAAKTALTRYEGSLSVINLNRSQSQREIEDAGPGGGHYRYNRSYLQQFYQCLQRQMILTYRTSGLWIGSWIKASTMALVAGSLFYNLPLTASYARTRLGLFFFLLTYIGVGAVEILSFLMSSRQIYYAQKKAGYYQGAAYYFALLFSQFPLSIVETFLFSITVYGLSGLNGNVGSDAFWFFYLTIFAINMTARSFVLFVHAISPNPIISFVLIPLSNILFVQFSGFLEPREQIPLAWRWMNYASYYTWAWRGLALNEMYNQVYTCDTTAAQCAQAQTGLQELLYYDINEAQYFKWTALGYVTIFFAGWNGFALLALLLIDYSRADTPQVADFGAGEVAKQEVAEKVKREAKENIGLSEDDQPRDTAIEPLKEAAYFQWQNLDYSVTLKDGTDRQLLNKCYGFARPHVMVALMGASGAGKSTLLDVLAGKKTAGKITGDIMLNGKPFDAHTFNHASGYVEQFDSHNALSTVKEAIVFSAKLRLPTFIAYNDVEVEKRVMHVMEVLDLHHVANDIIGMPGFGGVSPEVRKKVTIAVELVMEPSLLLCDEPTTGLDSAGAYSVMTAIKKLASSMAVICTIHQPSAEIVHMFDWLLLLKPGGETVFFGPVEELIPHFVKNKIAPEPTEDLETINVADFALEAIRNMNKNSGKGANGESVDMVKAFNESDRFKFIQEELKQVRTGDNPGDDIGAAAASKGDKDKDDNKQQSEDKNESQDDGERKNKNNDKADVPPVGSVVVRIEPVTDKNRDVVEQVYKPANNNTTSTKRNNSGGNMNNPAASQMQHEDHDRYASYIFQTYLLTKRFFLNTWRNKPTLITRYCNPIIFGFIVGTLFFQLNKSENDALNYVSVMFSAIIIAMFISSSALPEVFAVRPIYFRETSSQMYDALPWFLARRLADIPYYVVEMTIFAVMVYFLTNLTLDNNGGYFGWFLFTLLGVRAAGSAFTQMVATAFGSPEVAAAVQSTGFTIFFLFTGFLIPKGSIKGWWIWMYYLSFIRYPLQFLIADELLQDTFDCTGLTSDTCPYENGTDILELFDIDYSFSGRALNLGVLFIFLTGFLTMGYLALRYINHIKR